MYVANKICLLSNVYFRLKKSKFYVRQLLQQFWMKIFESKYMKFFIIKKNVVVAFIPDYLIPWLSQ